MTTPIKSVRYYITLFSGIFFICCSNDDVTPLNEESNTEETGIIDNGGSGIIFNNEDISFNLLNLKWEAATGPNNEQVVYDIFLGDTKLVDSNEDTDYTITGLEANTEYTGKIVPKTVDNSTVASPKRLRSAKELVELNPINFSVKTLQFANPDAPKPILNPVTVDGITKVNATVKWEAATVSDNSTVSYNVYLNGDLKASNLQSTAFTFINLKEKTKYSGVVLAISENQKSAVQSFEFITASDPDEVPTTSVVFFRGNSATFSDSDFIQLIPIVAPADATAVTFNWESSNNDIATVDESGYVNTKNIGNTTITAFFADDPSISTSIEITVEAKSANSGGPLVSMQPKRASLLVGDMFKYKVNRFNFQAGDAIDSSLEFTSSDPSIATIDSEGNVTAIQNGTVAISITSSTGNDRLNAIVMLRVVSTPIPVTSIKTFKKEKDISLFEGGAENVGYIVSPEDATNRTLIYTSTNESVVEVSTTGFVRAVGEGEANVIITSFSNNEVSETLNYKVLEDPVSFDEATKVFTAPADSKISLQLTGFLALPIDTTSDKSAFVEIEYIVNDSSGISLLDQTDNPKFIESSIVGENEFEFFGDAYDEIDFIMPSDGQVTIGVKVIVVGPDDLAAAFFDLNIVPETGLKKNVIVDDLIVNP